MLNIITKKTLVLLGLFVCTVPYSANKALAAPSINGVNGSITSGQNVTINGSAFGTKPKAAPVKFENFDNGSAGTSLNARDPLWKVYDCADMGNPSPNCDHKGALYSSDYAHSGNLSVGRHIVDSENFNTNYFTMAQPDTEMFISYWYRTANADTSDDSVIKMSRINSSTAAGGGGVYNGAGNTSLGGTYNLSYGSGPYCAFNNGTDMWELFFTANDGSVAYLNTPPPNKWFRVDMYKKLSTPGAYDGSIFVNILGTDSKSNPAAMTRAANKSFLLDTVLLGLEDGKASKHNYDVFIDDMYIDTTQARVEICESSTWGARTQCEIQPATAWSDTSVTLTVNQGAIPVSASQYLYVVDSKGAVNANGYPISFGASSTLAPPSGLRVIM